MSHIRVARLRFDSITPDGQGAVAVDFRPQRPLHFIAGQHGLWVIPGGGVRPFTIASSPQEELVTLGTSVASRSRFKRAITALTVQDAVRLIGPIGNFTLDGTALPVVMLAQGMGVTPFRAMLRHLARTGQDKRTTLVHVGAAHPFRGDTEPVAAQTSYPSSREGFVRAVEHAAADQSDATFMVSGSSPFVSATVDLLNRRGVDTAQIRRDTFWGYRPIQVSGLTSNAPNVLNAGDAAGSIPRREL
jgi:ferredoxin-NADP reductase